MSIRDEKKQTASVQCREYGLVHVKIDGFCGRCMRVGGGIVTRQRRGQIGYIDVIFVRKRSIQRIGPFYFAFFSDSLKTLFSISTKRIMII